MASATDIITYIGVPLAVLGVLPILYNTIVTLAAVSKVKRLLRHSKIHGITRGDVINHIIEVDLPRYTIAPLDRDGHRDEYWGLCKHPSLITGGSWTTFNWKTHPIGVKTQRIEYADQIRQPQAEASFEQLVSYLLDLGAVPSTSGFRLLRTSGLWVPTGTTLLLSPDGHEPALSIAPLDDSDGHLSLTVRWSDRWSMRDHTALPPYWIRISKPSDIEVQDLGEANDEPDETESVEKPSAQTRNTLIIAEANNETPTGDDQIVDLEAAVSSASSKSSNEEPKKEKFTHKVSRTYLAKQSICCQFSIDGLTSAISEDRDFRAQGSLSIEHLRIHSPYGNSSGLGVWFASAATALGASSSSSSSSSSSTQALSCMLWNYAIPPAVLAFAARETVPCGVLVELGAAAERETPEWATRHSAEDDAREEREATMRGMRDEAAERQAEARMSASERAAADERRRQRRFHAFIDGNVARRKRDEARVAQRTQEALQSRRWHNGLVARHNLAWLRRHGHLSPAGTEEKAEPKEEEAAKEEDGEHEDVVEGIVYRMVMDAAYAAEIGEALDSWKAWADSGGMKLGNLRELAKSQVKFAEASLLLAIIRKSATAVDGSVARDLQETIKIWKRVRVG